MERNNKCEKGLSNLIMVQEFGDGEAGIQNKSSEV